MALYLIIERISFWPLFTMPPDSRGSVAVNHIKQFPFLEAFDIFAYMIYMLGTYTPFEKKNEWDGKKKINVFLFFYLRVLIEEIKRLFFCLEI